MKWNAGTAGQVIPARPFPRLQKGPHPLFSCFFHSSYVMARPDGVFSQPSIPTSNTLTIREGAHGSLAGFWEGKGRGFAWRRWRVFSPGGIESCQNPRRHIASRERKPTGQFLFGPPSFPQPDGAHATRHGCVAVPAWNRHSKFVQGSIRSYSTLYTLLARYPNAMIPVTGNRIHILPVRTDYSSMPVENPLWTNVQGWVPPYHTGEEWLQTAPQAFTQKKDPHRRKAMGGLENQRSGTVGSTRPCRRKKQYYRSVYATRTRRVACSLSPMAKYTYSFAGIRREMRRERLVGIINIGQRERGTSPGNSPRLLSRFPGPETAGKLLPSLRYC